MPRRATTETASTIEQMSTAKLRLHERIAARAFELYLERGGEHGHDLEDWLRAEQEVGANRMAVSAA